ncbi:hypothetical protein [Methanimicrococcus hacksteinii]|uniref:hypothetical protein n=1 Tax=Methanimicrococcus hacksteinii TaxID=3028293 RepID=UPI00298F231E|nr:hypothetical protein [Methanimicrococcus sp. At1]
MSLFAMRGAFPYASAFFWSSRSLSRTGTQLTSVFRLSLLLHYLPPPAREPHQLLMQSIKTCLILNLIVQTLAIIFVSIQTLPDIYNNN